MVSCVGVDVFISLGTWALLLLFVEGQQGHIGDLDYLETDTRNVTHGVALSTEACHQNLVVFLNVVEATVPGHEGRDLLAVLDQLYSDALPDGRVGLLGLNTNFLEHDALGVGGASKRVGLPACAQVSLLVIFVVPPLVTAVATVLARRPQSTRLAWTRTLR